MQMIPLPFVKTFFRSRLSLSRDLGFIVAIIIGLILAGFYTVFYYLPKATVTLSVEAESLVKSFDSVASSSAERIDIPTRVIPAVEISMESKKSAGAAATGSKEVGDKARGEITIYNKTTSSKNFPSKTPLSKGRTQGSDLIYLIDSEINIPPQSSGVSGVATVSATAEKIGDEYNISSNNTLSVNSYSTSSFIAENTRSFSGGSRRSITVVTDDDQKKLLISVQSQLEASLKEELKNKLVADQKMEEGSLDFTTLTKTFDKNISEEAANFNLILEEKVTALVYSENDLKSLLNDIFKEYIPTNSELYGSDRTYEVISAKYEGGNLFFTSKVKGYIVPRIDEEKIRSSLVGLGLIQARQYLGSVPNISSFQIDNSVNIPGFTFLPREINSIKIVVVRK